MFSGRLVKCPRYASTVRVLYPEEHVHIEVPQGSIEVRHSIVLHSAATITSSSCSSIAGRRCNEGTEGEPAGLEEEELLKAFSFLFFFPFPADHLIGD